MIAVSLKRVIVVVAEKIKTLREASGLTQAALARQLGVTRSGVNAWEMGLTVPSTQYIVELAQLFHVSTDYLLGVNKTATIDVSDMDDDDVEILAKITLHLRKKNRK